MRLSLLICLAVLLIACKKSKTQGQTIGTDPPSGMKYIPKGKFIMGGRGEQALPREFPQHPVQVDAFFIDSTEVTNRQFAEFVEETGYVTLAERPVDWEQLSKLLPPGTPKPPEENLAAGSLVFVPRKDVVDLSNHLQWWGWTRGASWRHPNGPGSTIIGKDDHPVVHIAIADAREYAKWAGKRLPTEAEWEWASRGGLKDVIYPWGNTDVNKPPFSM